MKNTIPGLIAAAAMIAATSAADAAVPTAEDFAACNAEARDAVSGSASPSTSPTQKDQDQARRERRGEMPGKEGTGATGKIAESQDPQLGGMDPEGAKDPAYRAAYRSCMRKAGF